MSDETRSRSETEPARLAGLVGRGPWLAEIEGLKRELKQRRRGRRLEKNEVIFYDRKSQLSRPVRYANGSKNVLNATMAFDSKRKYEKLASVVHVP